MDQRTRDQYWLFLYEVQGANDLEDEFLKDLKRAGVEFLRIKPAE